jgi:hypothetical protein
MKSLEQFKSVLTEEEKSDYSKFDALVRAGLANKAQIARLHKILDKMTEDRPQFNNADRMIMQNLFNKMVDLISNNKQIFQQTRKAVREDYEPDDGALTDEQVNQIQESLKATSDYKIGPSGRKVKAHRFKVGDIERLDVDDEADTKDKQDIKEEILRGDPPFVLVLKRKAIRMYPDGTHVALYWNDTLKKYFSVPYDNKKGVNGIIQTEETKETPKEIMAQLEYIKNAGEKGKVSHADGTSSQVDATTAHAILKVHKALNDDNKKKIADLANNSKDHFSKVVAFAQKNASK